MKWLILKGRDALKWLDQWQEAVGSMASQKGSWINGRPKGSWINRKWWFNWINA
jgi:hypothetical protein